MLQHAGKPSMAPPRAAHQAHQRSGGDEHRRETATNPSVPSEYAAPARPPLFRALAGSDVRGPGLPVAYDG